MSATVLERGAIAIPAKTKSRLGRGKLAISALALLAAVGAAGFGHHWWTAGRFLESTDDAYVGGNVTAISPHVAGFVADVLVTDNQLVHAGDTLIRLDDRDFRAALDRAEAILRQRKAALDNLQARLT